MTLRPMFPPRAESVDSFSHQPAVDHRPHERPPKPAEGLSRRNLMAGLALLSATLPAAAASAVAVSAPSVNADPAFALIRAKRLADVKHCWAIEAQDAAESQFGGASDAAWQAAERCEAACVAAQEADWKLGTTQPTTLAGVVAVLRLANLIEDEGGEWPYTDTIGPDGWHYQLRATMAAAIETILRGEVRA
ncbi:hypothetical protein SAMN05443247_08246 [Bradyrhizobium erythrophlei]|jgi:hypothetical protein|nr:hypothetical protein SAMN05443247_08246 [Bradyrhizobium erythrophlei]